MYTFLYQWDCKETMIIVYHRFLYTVNLICRNGSRYMRHVSVISRHPISIDFRELTGCQRDPRDFGCHRYASTYIILIGLVMFHSISYFIYIFASYTYHCIHIIT